MTRLLPLLAAALVPCAAIAEGAVPALAPPGRPSISPPERATGRPSISPPDRATGRPSISPPDRATGIAPSLAHATAEQTVTDLMPHLAIYGGYYSGAFEVVVGVYCDRRTGEIYVADQHANTIEIFSDTGAPLFAFSDDEHLSGPMRVAVDGEDRIYVIDADHARIKVFDYRGEFVSYLVPSGFENQKVSFTAMMFDENGDFLVGESLSGQVVLYDKSLRPKLRIGTFGEGPEEFSGIVGIAADKANIYVASQRGMAVHVFSRAGRFLRGWGYHDAGVHNVSLPAGIAVDSKGQVILLDTLRQEVKYFDADGALIGLFGGLGRHAGAVAYPTDLSMDRAGRLCIADSGNVRAQVLAPVEAVPTGRVRDPRPQQEAIRPTPQPVSKR